MGTTTSAFSGNAAIAYAAFNLRDSYYPDMARFVIDAAKARLSEMPKSVVELASGIGMSTMEILKDLAPESFLLAVEPEEGMRYFCKLNTMGDPRVLVAEGRGEDLFTVLRNFFPADMLLCCQAFHLFNPPGKESLIPVVLRHIANGLRPGGVFAFDLGGSNYEFATPLADHRSGNRKPGEIMTELAHPLYLRAHDLVLDIVRREFPDFNRENLWPATAARMSFKFLSDACEQVGLGNLEVTEDLSPISGKRVINFIRNGWTVFFRWPPLSELPAERKMELMNETLNGLFREPDFAAMSTAMSYHPTAVFTAVKG